MAMNSRERLLAAISGETPSPIPLICRFFGFRPKPEWTWSRNGMVREFWYTGRLEHLHTLPQPWDVEDDFARVEQNLALGLDEVLEISPPWSADPRVSVTDVFHDRGVLHSDPVAARTWETPEGPLTFAVRRSGETQEPGWVVQPDFPPLFEDFNIPRMLAPLVSDMESIQRLKFLLRPPDNATATAFRERMHRTRAFAKEKGVLTAGWSLFGMDAAVWLCGAENAVLMACEQPEIFRSLMDVINNFDRMRTMLLLDGGVDLVVQRGWYSSVDFWSPTLFRKYVLPTLKRNVADVHAAGSRFAYVMTTQTAPLLPMLAEAGVDLWYWYDPVMGDITPETAKETLGSDVCVAGGINAPITLTDGTEDTIRKEVESAITHFAETGLILEPVDSLFPETPWQQVENLIRIRDAISS